MPATITSSFLFWQIVFFLVSSRSEFCYTVLRLLSKCGTAKRRPLAKSFPGLCQTVEAARAVVERCKEDGVEWSDLRDGLENCTEAKCDIEEGVWAYARKNLAMLNIFIKVGKLVSCSKSVPFFQFTNRLLNRIPMPRGS